MGGAVGESVGFGEIVGCPVGMSLGAAVGGKETVGAADMVGAPVGRDEVVGFVEVVGLSVSVGLTLGACVRVGLPVGDVVGASSGRQVCFSSVGSSWQQSAVSHASKLCSNS